MIDTLHATGRRLEELTGGEVDSVVDREGGTFLLQHAQEQLRHSEAAKQAGILNALPASIALLDARGLIVSVNEAWRQFSGANALQDPGHGLGLNYLEVCDTARGDGSCEARASATGIRSVLDGTATSFSIEYPCHSPTEQRWFLMTVTPLAGSSGAVVMHLNITERKRSEEETLRFVAAMDSVADAIYLIDRSSMKLVHVNDAACRMQNLTRDELLALGPGGLLKLSRAELERTYDAIIASDGDPAPLELQRTCGDGSQVWVEVRRHAQRTGDRWMIVTLVREISARKETDRRLKRLNRVYAVLSGINSLIVRVADRDELFRGACRTAIDQGGFRMAWIGLVDREAGIVRPVASAGDVRDFFEDAPLGLIDGASHRRGLAGRAVAEMAPMVLNDALNDPRVERKEEFRRRGINSLAVIPLVVGGEPVGVLALYFAEAGFFDEEETRLLVEIAGNISLALVHIEKAGKLERMTRVNAMLSGINGAIVRIRDRHALFAEACRIAVQAGGFDFAWICTVDEVEQRCRPVAWAGGDDGYLDIIRDRVSLRDDAPGGHGISARAVRERRAFVVNDIEADETLRHKEAFAERGVMSLASIPMLVAGRAIGAFTLHAAEGGFFDKDEMKLLKEVAGNIAFALKYIEKEEKIRRLTRVYAVLSGINSLIVRAVDRDELFREASRIAVEHGEFRLAWIAVLDKGSGILKPVASAGDVRDFFASSNLAAAHNKPGGIGLPGRAIREMKPMISNDVRNDPNILGKRELEERGINSAALIPLVVRGEAKGVLALYSADAGFFDDEEVQLLQELGGDIAFAIDHIDKQERLEYLAYYDALTGLPNRSLFLGRVAQGMRKAESGGHKLALVLLDLERFKDINDTLGRAAGDTLLKEVAHWLTRRVGDAELVGHMGADHFAVLVPIVKREGAVGRLLEKTLKAFLDHPFPLAGGMFRIAAKVGVAVFPLDGANADTLFKNAEAALKKAKASGDRWLFYKPAMTEMVAGKLTLENQLRLALDRGEFVLHYQPKVNLSSGKLTGAEALIRWNDPRTGLVPPGRFIPVLEETGLIHEVGRWALRQAIADYLRWRAAGLPAVRVAVNVSPLQLRSRGFIAEIRQAIGIDAHAPDGIELEITESLIMEDVKHSIASLQAIRAMGVSVAIDDFGTGFSSLSYLAKLPVDTLKIDRSFVTDMTAGPEGLALVSTIINLAHSLKLNVVAEGVETDEQSRLLRLLDCDEMQGFLFSKAVPGAAFEAGFLATPPAG